MSTRAVRTAPPRLPRHRPMAATPSSVGRIPSRAKPCRNRRERPRRRQGPVPVMLKGAPWFRSGPAGGHRRLSVRGPVHRRFPGRAISARSEGRPRAPLAAGSTAVGTPASLPVPHRDRSTRPALPRPPLLQRPAPSVLPAAARGADIPARTVPTGRPALRG